MGAAMNAAAPNLWPPRPLVDPLTQAVADAATFRTGGVVYGHDGSVTRLSPEDLDRMAIAIHRETDPDFDIPELARDFGAYAPDPDHDYQRGHDAGYQEGLLEGRAARDHRDRVALLDVTLVCLAILLVVLVVAVSGQP